MATWRYAFMFPGSGSRLLPANLIRTFADAGFKFDRTIFRAVAIDEDGHLEFAGELELSEHPVEELVRRLNSGEQFLVECRNRDSFFSIASATQYSNPHIMIGWSRRLFETLNEDLQQRYWQLLRQVAKGCQAAYVIIVDDPPDYFEDRFLEVCGQRFLEKQTPSGRKYDIRSIWIDANCLDPRPEGVSDLTNKNEADGYLEFAV